MSLFAHHCPAIYLAHGLFWATFLLGLRAFSWSAVRPPILLRLLGLHGVGFVLLYWGLRPSALVAAAAPPTQPGLALTLMLMAAALSAWALTVFNAWGVVMNQPIGHHLATGGPYRFVRHPIYLAQALLAMGSVLWWPSPWVAAGAALVVLAGGLRASAEEARLRAAFGSAYAAYCARTKRFIPGVY